MNKRILVLGGTGFIGKALVKKLVKNNAGMIISGSRHPLKRKNVIEKKIDIYNRRSLISICRGSDIVVNCIGQVTDPLEECIRQNSVGMFRLAEAVNISKSRLIHLSTVLVYGSANTVSETSQCHPETPYAAAKYGAECILSSEISQKRLTIVRLSNIYGVGSKGITGYFLREYKKKRMLHFNNDGRLLRWYLHVDDLSRILCKVISNHSMNAVYNLSGPEKFTIKELIQIMKRESGVSWQVRYTKTHSQENIHSISLKKIQKLLPLNYQYSMSDFLREQLQKKV